MFGIIALVLIAIVALTILSFAVHFLFSPWLLLVALGVLAWIKFRPRRSHREPAARRIRCPARSRAGQRRPGRAVRPGKASWPSWMRRAPARRRGHRVSIQRLRRRAAPDRMLGSPMVLASSALPS